MNIVKNDKLLIWFSYIIIILFSLVCLIPFIMVLSASLSNDQEVALHGFSFIPRNITTYTYEFLFASKGALLLKAYGITIFTVVFGTLFSLAVTVSYAYVAANSDFKYAKVLSFVAWFTMVFSGGLLPWYILTTKYYSLHNNLWALFIPYAINVFNMFLMRNFFKGIPKELSESAKIDGAGHFRIYFSIMIPLAQVGIVTIALFYALSYWNDFFLSLMLITDRNLYPVQLLLYNMMSNIAYLTSGGGATDAYTQGMSQVIVPTMTARMALTCITIGPVILVYPFAQRFFVKGITIGAVKG
ncbi:carbohydrate ABC transporter permease [Paenibacillus sp. CMAA1364]